MEFRSTLVACVALFSLLAAAPTVADSPDKSHFLPGNYRLAPEDVLDISVWREEKLEKQVLVRPDGGISFPLVGEIQAAGRTAEDVRQEVTDKLKKFIANPVVSVSVVKIQGYKIYVLGKVNKPGDFIAGRYVDVLQALSMAGGVTPFAEEDNIKVLRKENCKDRVFPFRYSDVRKGKNLEQNITLMPGDVVVVP
jgi:polysaccharide export outer membrane protein